MSAAPTEAERPVLISPAAAAQRAKMSVSNIRRRCASDGLGFRPGGRGEWQIREADFERWMRGEKLR